MEHSSTAMLDRLSDLPDALLLRILSLAFLGACRTLVKTSLVSRRWRHLWREVPRLEIDQREFLQEATGPTTRHRHSKRDKRDPVKEWDRFEKFTENLLSRHSPDLPLDTLRLYVVNPPQGHGRRNQSDASRLVRLCLERCRPVELGIYSNTLVDLRGLGLEVDLTRLTTLCLSDVVLRSSFAQHIGASGCPRLKHLQLEDCGLAFTELLLSRMLKTLSVFDTYNVHRRRGSVTRTRIEAPGLLSMMADKIDGVIFDAPSLVTAYVCPLLHRGCVDQEDDQLHILCGLQNATNLHLSGLPSIDKVPKFCNLKTLLLEECNLTGQVCTALDLFMRAAPNLDQLSVRNCEFGLPTDDGVPYKGQQDLQMFHNLRALRLEKCDLTLRSYGEAPTLLEYVLQNAPNLERLALWYCKLPGGMQRRSKSMSMSYQCMNLKSAAIRYLKQDGVSQMVDLLLGTSKNLQRSNILVSKA